MIVLTQFYEGERNQVGIMHWPYLDTVALEGMWYNGMIALNQPRYSEFLQCRKDRGMGKWFIDARRWMVDALPETWLELNPSTETK